MRRASGVSVWVGSSHWRLRGPQNEGGADHCRGRSVPGEVHGERDRRRSASEAAGADPELAPGEQEIAIKAGLKKLTLGEPAATYLPAALASTGFEVLPISVAHAASVEPLPPHHRDPFDRLLVAQALLENTPIASADPAFDLYGVARRWWAGMLVKRAVSCDGNGVLQNPRNLGSPVVGLDIAALWALETGGMAVPGARSAEAAANVCEA